MHLYFSLSSVWILPCSEFGEHDEVTSCGVFRLLNLIQTIVIPSFFDFFIRRKRTKLATSVFHSLKRTPSLFAAYNYTSVNSDERVAWFCREIYRIDCSAWLHESNLTGSELTYAPSITYVTRNGYTLAYWLNVSLSFFVADDDITKRSRHPTESGSQFMRFGKWTIQIAENETLLDELSALSMRCASVFFVTN